VRREGCGSRRTFFHLTRTRHSAGLRVSHRCVSVRTGSTTGRHLSARRTGCIVHAQDRQEPIRLRVSMLKNGSPEFVNPTLQRNELIKAFERMNKSKDVKKGKAAPIEAIPLESTEEPDPDVRDKDCEFVLHTNLTEVVRAGTPEISIPPPGAVEVGGISDPRAYPADYHSATVTYRIVRSAEITNWASGLVSAHAQVPEETLVTQLMDQIASRVATELRTPHPPAPQ